MTPALGSPGSWLAAAAVGFMMFRRIRRNIGQQRWRPGSVRFRLVVVSVVALLLLAGGAFVPHGAWAVPLALAAGGALGWLSLGHTHVHWDGGQKVYTPNPWIGGALSVVLLGRLAWRMTQLQAGAAQPQHASALTMAIAGILMGYSIVYLGGLMRRMQALGEAPPPA